MLATRRNQNRSTQRRSALGNAVCFDALEGRRMMAADLVIESAWVVSGNAEPGLKGGSVTLSYTIANRGNAASGPFHVAPFQARTSVPDVDNSELFFTRHYTGGLSAGATYTDTITFNLHWSAQAQDDDNTGFITVAADIYRKVAENNEGNNWGRGAGIDSVSFRYEGHLPRDPSTNKPFEATPMPANGLIDGNIGDELIGSRDIDIFSVNCTAGQSMEADLDTTSFSSLDAAIRVYDPSGNLVASNDDGGYAPRGVDPYVQWGAGVAGRYYVVVSGKGNFNANPRLLSGRAESSTGAYALSVRPMTFPTVKVNTSFTAVEGNANKPATITVTRTGGSLDRDLFVKWETYGTAVVPADLNIPIDGVTIPAGQSSVTLSVVPTADGISEPMEYFILNLLPDQRYVRDPVSSSAPVYIQDDPATDLPDVTSANFVFDTNQGSYFVFGFDQDITGFAADDIMLLNTRTNANLSGFSAYRIDNRTYGIDFRNMTGKTLPDGTYRVTLKADAVSNAVGKKNLAQSFTFHALAGDADRDGAVGFSDLLILSQNYGTGGKTFSGGNFDYDPQGNVDFNDLLTLSQRYGINYTAALTATQPAPARTFASRRAIAHVM